MWAIKIIEKTNYDIKTQCPKYFKEKKMKNWLIINLLLVSLLQIKGAQEEKYNVIESSIKLKMSFNDSTFSYIPYLTVNNTIVLSNYTKDTLSLSLNKKEHALSFIDEFDIQNLRVSNNLLRESVLKVNYNKKLGVLDIIKTTLDTLNFSININYSYKYDINDFFKSMDNKFCNINCGLDNSNWYFYNENVKLNKLEVFNDSNYIFFCDANLISKDSVKTVYDISSIDRDNDLFFSIINSNTYKHRSVNIDNTNYHLYLLKSDSVYIDTITKKNLPYRIRQKHYFDSIQNTFVENVNFISSFYKKDKDINIIEINWKNSDYTFGRGYKNEITGDGYIRCDSKFLSNSGITHECLHFLCDINADKRKSGYLFFNH